MKKLRMIMTSVVVLAIVGGAFAFKTKTGIICYKTGATPGDCTKFETNIRLTTNTLFDQYRYYSCWSGDQTECTAAGNNACQNLIRFQSDGI